MLLLISVRDKRLSLNFIFISPLFLTFKNLKDVYEEYISLINNCHCIKEFKTSTSKADFVIKVFFITSTFFNLGWGTRNLSTGSTE